MALSLMQDRTFQEAVATQRFRRRVKRLRQDFVILAGYGRTGRLVARELDEAGCRVVVIDVNDRRIERLAADALYADAPGLAADAGLPGVLGTAGLDSPRCTGVLALTDNDDTNLAIVMASTLLRPSVPVIARCHARLVEERMREFGASSVINPGDRYGGYLVLSLQRPSVYRLVTWLMAGAGTPLPRERHIDCQGTWVVAAEGEFGEEITNDLGRAGLHVERVDPRADHPDVSHAVGFVAGTELDTLNLALAEHARHDNPDVFVSVLQRSDAHRSLVEALAIDAVHTPTALVATEALARVVTPVFWGFVEHAIAQDEEWAAQVLARIVDVCGRVGPSRAVVTMGRRGAPAVERWLQHSPLTLGELMRHPDDRERTVSVVPLVLMRDGESMYVPGGDLELEPGDRILFLGTPTGLATLRQTLDYESVVEYVATGRRVPDGWVWRRLTGVRALGEQPEVRRQIASGEGRRASYLEDDDELGEGLSPTEVDDEDVDSDEADDDAPLEIRPHTARDDDDD